MKKQSPLVLTIIITLLLFAIIALGRLAWKSTPPRGAKQPWMNIWVHGTFNLGLGLLNVFNLFSDNVQGTEYASLIKKMRKDPFYFQEQPIQQRGLVSLEPTFAVDDDECKRAIFPITASFAAINHTIAPSREKDLHYTFGWTGLMSQSYRRKEALRLFNALQEELVQLHAQNIYPRIRLIAHSHGGNICLNLAAINDAITYLCAHPGTTATEIPSDEPAREMLVHLLGSTPATPQRAKGQKHFDYHPASGTLTIDELLTFGTPIQPETSPYFFSNTFKKVYNFYSDNDLVQKIDFISSKRYYSDQRLENAKDNASHIVQARIMVDFEPTSNTTTSTGAFAFLKNIFGGSNPATERKDPTHKDLWFLAWNKEYTQQNSPFAPLPMVVLAPLLTHALASAPALHDVDLNFTIAGSDIRLDVMSHNSSRIAHRTTFPHQTFLALKEKVLQWQPHNLTREAASRAIRGKLS